jgi:anti-sigma regulatory factor (Ser/Thr protein kinase)
MSAFISAGVQKGERVLAMIPGQKIPSVAEAVGESGGLVGFVDIREIGRNPARIIPAWQEFFSRAGADGYNARGIGEPIWASRTAAELVESQVHESLINVAFKAATGWLICPYDVATLPPAVVEEARHSHPVVRADGTDGASPEYREIDSLVDQERFPLPAPVGARTLSFGRAGLSELRRFVKLRASEAGLDPARTSEVVVAVSEVAANSIRHGGGSGTLRTWEQAGEILFEVADAGRITDLMVGRVRPNFTDENGFGLWLTNQICDLVQVRSSAEGSIVRLHIAV